MANSFIESFSETTQDKLTKAMLECSMLFSLNRNALLSDGRKNMFLQSVFAITCSDSREWTVKDVHDVFDERFSKDYDYDIIKKAMKKLTKDGWLIPTEKGFVPHESIAKRLREYDSRIGQRTEAVFNAIIENTEQLLDEKLGEEECAQMRENIKNAFNLYVRMYGFESFVSNDNKITSDIIEDEDIVKAAMENLIEVKGETLVGVLSDLLEHPTPEQAETMGLWVKIFIGTQVMRLDPQLSELEAQNLKGKKFVLDTDFLLYCLVTHPKQSQSYRRLLSVLRKFGCQLIIPEDVVIEVLNHAQCAERNYRRFAKMLKAVNREAVELKANNVFVKDYCLYDLESDHRQTIKQYMNNNFLSDDDPLDFLKDVIRDQLRIEPCNDDNLHIDQEYQEHMEELTRKICYRTRYADNDKWRTEEEIDALSRTDARLYLSVLSLNKKIMDSNTGELLRSNAYLVTGTTKSVKSAQEMGIHRSFVTRPELLINLMSEIGEFGDPKHSFVNLFDNPFLAHVIDSNWGMIRNLSEAGLNMHDKSITKLKKDLGIVYHKYLTKEADVEVIETTPDFDVVKIKRPKVFFEFAEEVNKLNYQLIPNLQEMVDEYRDESNKRMAAEEKSRSTELLLAKKAHGYQVYLQKMGKVKKSKEVKKIKL